MFQLECIVLQKAHDEEMEEVKNRHKEEVRAAIEQERERSKVLNCCCFALWWNNCVLKTLGDTEGGII